MLQAISEQKGYTIFEVTKTKSKDVVAYRVFPTIRIGDARWGKDVGTLAEADRLIPVSYNEYCVIGYCTVYRVVTFGNRAHYRVAVTGNPEQEIAGAEPFDEVNDARRQAALENYKMAKLGK